MPEQTTHFDAIQIECYTLELRDILQKYVQIGLRGGGDEI